MEWSAIQEALRSASALEVSRARTRLVEFAESLREEIGAEGIGDRWELPHYFVQAVVRLARIDGQADPERGEIWFAWAREAIAAFEASYQQHYAPTIELEHARWLWDRGDLVAARERIERTLDSPARQGALAAFLLADLAEIDRVEGLWEKSELHVQEASRAVLDDDGLKRVSLVRSQLELDLGLVDRAAASIAVLREAAVRSKDAEGELVADLQEAKRLIAADLFELAEPLLEGSMERAERLGWPSVNQARIQIALGVARAELERQGSAFSPSGEDLLAALVDEPVLGTDDRLAAALPLVEIYLRGARAEDARALLARVRAELEHGRGSVPESRRTSEEARLEALWARLALDAGSTSAELAQRRVALAGAFARFLDAWRRLPYRTGGLGFLYSRGRTAVLSELVRLTLAVEPGEAGRSLALGHVLEAQAQGSLARMLGISAGSVAEVQAALVPHGGLLLVYVPSHERTHLFVLDGRALDVHELPGRYALSRLIRPYLERIAVSPARRALGERGTAELAALGRTLTHALLPASVLERVEGGTPLTIVGREMLYHAPFEALPLDDGRHLGTVVALDELPSLPVGLHLAARIDRAPRDLDLVVLAAPEHGPVPLEGLPEIVPLDIASSELAALAECWPAERVRVWRGKEAHVGRLESSEISRSRELVLIAHGTWDPRQPLGSCLILAPRSDTEGDEGDDGILGAEEVLRLESPPLVVLAACESARGQERPGEDGLAHLGGVFLAAGADCVLLSRHRLELTATLELLSVLQERLAAGDAPAEALRAARASVAERRPHPFYHGLIQAVGLGQRALR